MEEYWHKKVNDIWICEFKLWIKKLWRFFSPLWYRDSLRFQTNGSISSIYSHCKLNNNNHFNSLRKKRNTLNSLNHRKHGVGYLRIHWRLSTILKTSNKSVWCNVFWYVKVCIFWKCIQYLIHWNKTQMLKKFPSDEINGTNAHHSFTFNLRFLYELKHKIRLSKTVVRFSIFDSVSFVLKFIFFCWQNTWTLWL